MFRKRRRPTPHFKIPSPYNPIQGDHANLRQDGISPFCAMMQVMEEDTYDNYVVCRGFDPRILRFMENISVAKPFGKRTPGTYQIGEVYPAFLPTQGNANFMDFRQVTYTPPSPNDVLWRVGQNPGVAVGGLDGGQPENLSGEIEILYDNNGKVINWLLIDSNGQGSTLATFTFDGPTHSGGTFGVAEQIVFTFDDFITLDGVTPPLSTVVNDYNLIALTGDFGLCAYRSTDDEWVLIDVYPAKTRRFYFQLDADWPNGLDQTSTDAVLLCPATTHHGGDTVYTSFTLRDRFNKASNAKGTGATQDIGICELNYQTGQFDIRDITHVCRRGRGEVYAGFSDTSATFEVQNVIGFDGRIPEADPLTIYNELSIPALSTGDLVEIRWNSIAGRYYAMPPASPAGTRKIQGVLIALADGTGPYTGAQVATITIRVAPCSDADLLDTDVDVVDWSGCVFDLPEEDLLDVWVWASEGITDSRDPTAEEGDLTPCHWIADDRCCDVVPSPANPTPDPPVDPP